MAGHSKWANIRYRKAQQDAKRGKKFTQYIREIVMAARLAGEDRDANPRLRHAVDKALSNNMSRETIQRAIQRGIGNDPKDALFEIQYEGYGPGGVGFVLECLTNNKNRTVGEIRHLFTKFGGNLAQTGAVGFLFTAMGLIWIDPNISDEQWLAIAELDGIVDLSSEEDSLLISTKADALYSVQAELQNKLKLRVLTSEWTQIPQSSVSVDELIKIDCENLRQQLELLDDVQHVFFNLE